MDRGITRRGKPCWYTVDGVGSSAIIDAFMTTAVVFVLLKQYFSDKKYYTRLVELFNESIFLTNIGQAADIQTSNYRVESFTLDKYKAIVTNKTAHSSFYLPVALAMTMAEIYDPKIFDEARPILLEMGIFFQVQDDFLDCFGDPNITGKIGNDIQENKCTWLAVIAMQKANDDQKSIMMECYGSFGE